MVLEHTNDETVSTKYQDVIGQCNKALRRESPLHTIRRRLSIGLHKVSENEKDDVLPRMTTDKVKFRVTSHKINSPLRRTRSSVCMDSSLLGIPEFRIPSGQNTCSRNDRKMAPLLRRPRCTWNDNKPHRQQNKNKESGSGKYTSLAKTLSSIAQMSSRKENRIQRQTFFRSSLPKMNTKACSDCDTKQNTSICSKSMFTTSLKSKAETLNEDKPHKSAIFSSPDSGITSSLSSESFDQRTFVSPTRYDALDDESMLENDLNCTTDADGTDDFSLFCECNTSCQSNKAKGKRLSLDAGQMVIRRQSRELIKTTSRFRRLAKDQMKMWSGRRNTIDSEDNARRQQNTMLRVSASGRISLRQKNLNNAENRLSLFGNTAESLLTLMQQPEMLQAFRTFLKSEYSEENLDFWLECEEYRNMKPNRRKKMAAKIYATYLDAKAPREINIDAGTRARTECHLENPRENTFEEAQKHIFDLMERDSFRRFITSDKNM